MHVSCVKVCACWLSDTLKEKDRKWPYIMTVCHQLVLYTVFLYGTKMKTVIHAYRCTPRLNLVMNVLAY